MSRTVSRCSGGRRRASPRSMNRLSARLLKLRIMADRNMHYGSCQHSRDSRPLARSACSHAGSVHPRAGGEHSPLCPYCLGRAGSSPRGRGTHELGTATGSPRRFIPARAGNTPPGRGYPTRTPVHPRAGGEHSDIADCGRSGDGSSPRGRGTRGLLRYRASGGRFIPARAGNTRGRTIARRCASVHPRAGGEHTCAPSSSNFEIGSSPRGRGTQIVSSAPGPLSRFIPARAGNTTTSLRGASSPTVHPRAGGEHPLSSRLARYVSGSSPRGRGTLFSQPFDLANLF